MKNCTRFGKILHMSYFFFLFLKFIRSVAKLRCVVMKIEHKQQWFVNHHKEVKSQQDLFQIQNILPVLFNVKLKNYFFGSVIGMTPQIFVGATLGAGINEIIQKNIEVPSLIDLLFSQEIYVPIIAFIILIIIGIIIKNIFYKN